MGKIGTFFPSSIDAIPVRTATLDAVTIMG